MGKRGTTDSTIAATIDDNEDNENQQEELIYTATQILSGSFDKQLQVGGTKKHQNNKLLELRGKQVLDLFEESGVRQTDQTHCSIESIAKRAITSLNSRNLFASCASNDASPPSKKSKASPIWWKILRGPIISMAHVLVANSLIDCALNDKSNTNQIQSLYVDANHHLFLSLDNWMCNPSALLALADLTRMAKNVSTNTANGVHDANVVHQCMQRAMDLYVAAATCASQIRTNAISILPELESPDEAFLIATIALELGAQAQELEDNDDEVAYGQSKVVSTASYMAALLASALGQHEKAKMSLNAFGSHITRIHPLVWDTARNLTNCKQGSSPLVIKPVAETEGSFSPSIFREAIPRDLFRILNHAFRPDALYYKQSGYDRGVYYSFWSDYKRPTSTDDGTVMANDVVDHLILSYLLPRVTKVVGEDAMAELAGFEWWVHTRPHGANLGHQLHFDTDEALLEQDQVVSFPISATVLYLTDFDDETNSSINVTNKEQQLQHFGSTVLFDQTPYTKKNAERAWICVPKARSFLVFPGDLLHGVLPCAPVVRTEKNYRATKGNKTKETEKADRTKNEGNQSKSNNVEQAKRSTVQKTPHRLTFMVNFWARNIPERLKKRKLYGPSGPMPPKTRCHSWTNDLLDNGTYPRYVSVGKNDSVPRGSSEALTCVEPAWELLNGTTESQNQLVDLPPSGINQRFFVKNAPDFFHSTLFEK